MLKKMALAYSSGLDSSVMCKWLAETYDAEIVTFTADIGQGKEVELCAGQGRVPWACGRSTSRT